jgi:hypothetical protein
MNSLAKAEATETRMLTDSELDAVCGGQIGLGNCAQVAWRLIELKISDTFPCYNPYNPSCGIAL